MMMPRYSMLLILAIALALGCSSAPQERGDDLSGPLTQAPAKATPLPFNDSEIIPIGGLPARGPAAAPVTIVMFTDLQCPFCQRASLTITQLQQSYPDEVKLVLKHNPLPFHQQAKLAAQAALAAHQQGQFTQMHDLLFDKRLEFSKHPDDFDSYALKLAGELGLDVETFKKDFHSKAIAEQIERDIKLAAQVGARGTPTFWINGVQLVGAMPFETFKTLIDAQLARAQRLKAEENLSGDALYRAAVELNKTEAE